MQLRSRCTFAVRSAIPLGLAVVIQTSPTATAAPVDQVKKIVAPDGAMGNQFGRSVAFNGIECFIGAPERAEDGIFASGAGYFFGQNLGGVDNWGFALKRHEFAPGHADRFGYGVSMTGSHAAAGLWGDDDNGISAGAVIVYERNLGGIGAWGQRKKLVASDGATFDNFGEAVDMDDGIVIAGAAHTGDNLGAAYIYQQNFGGANFWGQSKKLTAPTPQVDSFYGTSVSVDNGTAAVGAPQEDEVGTNSGAVYVYEELPAGDPHGAVDRTGTWKLAKRLVAPVAAPNQQFGYSVCVKNGYVIVGAPFFNSNTSVFGTVYVFHRNQGGPGNYGLVQTLTNPDTDNLGDSYGWSTDMDGDLLVVGVSQEGAPGASAGAIYVFVKDLGGADNWGFLSRVSGPDPDHNDVIGYDVDIEGDTIVASAWGDSDISGFQGAVRVFRVNSICPEDLNGDGVVDTADLGIMIASFGGSGAGDLNLDGVVDTADLGALIGGYGATDCAFVP